MPKATPNNPNGSRHTKLYANSALVDAFDALASLRGISRSEQFARIAKAHLRSNSAKLRKAGVKLPEAIFEK